MKTKPKLSRDEILKYLSYDRENGIFTWKIARGRQPSGAIAGSVTSRGYVRIIFNKRQYFSHRLVWIVETNAQPAQFIDHIDGNRANNRIINLREASNYENQQNRKKCQSNSKSGLLGASPCDGTRPWLAQITINGKKKRIGCFKTKEDAHSAYMDIRRNVYLFNTL